MVSRVKSFADYRKEIRKVTFEHAILVSKAVKPEEKTVYDMYYDYSEPVKTLAPHRILAINRGEKEEFLKYGYILFALLIIPALNLSGMISSRRRRSPIAVRTLFSTIAIEILCIMNVVLIFLLYM